MNSPATGSSSSPLHAPLVLLGLGILLVIVAIVRLFIGTSALGFPPGDLPRDVIVQIWQARLLRIEIAIVVGAALAVSGVALQTLLRNPLAEPYILGLSTGAAAGVMAQAFLFYSLNIAVGASHIGAVVGAALSMGIVFLASRRRGMIDPLGLLLTGVVLSTINGSLIMLFNYLVGPGGIRDNIAHWMMGYLDEDVGYTTLGLVAAVTAAGLAALLAAARSMDIATLSDAEAQSLGVHMARLRTLLFLVASVLAAGAVVLAGPVAFVGLICPHVVRLLLGPRHLPLLIGSALAGATLILIADIVSAGLYLTGRVGLLPIGIFTAMVGGPVFLWMLHPQLGRTND